MTMKADPQAPLRAHLITLQLPYIREHFEPLAQQAAAQNHSHIDYLARLVEGEAHQRETRRSRRRLTASAAGRTLPSSIWRLPSARIFNTAIVSCDCS